MSIEQNKHWFTTTDLTDNRPEVEVQAEIVAIGQYYDTRTTVLNERTLRQWHALAEESIKQSHRLVRKYGVTVSYVNGQPYNLPEEMCTEIAQGMLRISIENVEHPVFTLQDTLAQRVWHDLTHYEAKTNFGYTGEVETCKAQIAHIADSQLDKEDIAYALQVDIVAQVANGLLHKRFPEQKVF